MKFSRRTATALMSTSLLFATACSNGSEKETTAEMDLDHEPRIAVARMNPTEGNETTGTVTFIEEKGGIRVIADIRNLSSGKHGFHVHEKGDCSAPDGTSAGGHFNPHDVHHAGPDADKRHVGDLGNLETTDAMSAMYERFDTMLSFDGENSILGKAVIIHAGEDDLESQPTGAAGARIACGVIKLDES